MILSSSSASKVITWNDIYNTLAHKIDGVQSATNYMKRPINLSLVANENEFNIISPYIYNEEILIYKGEGNIDVNKEIINENLFKYPRKRYICKNLYRIGYTSNSMWMGDDNLTYDSNTNKKQYSHLQFLKKYWGWTANMYNEQDILIPGGWRSTTSNCNITLDYSTISSAYNYVPIDYWGFSDIEFDAYFVIAVPTKIYTRNTSSHESNDYDTYSTQSLDPTIFDVNNNFKMALLDSYIYKSSVPSGYEYNQGNANGYLYNDNEGPFSKTINLLIDALHLIFTNKLGFDQFIITSKHKIPYIDRNPGLLSTYNVYDSGIPYIENTVYYKKIKIHPFAYNGIFTSQMFIRNSAHDPFRLKSYMNDGQKDFNYGSILLEILKTMYNSYYKHKSGIIDYTMSDNLDTYFASSTSRTSFDLNKYYSDGNQFPLFFASDLYSDINNIDNNTDYEFKFPDPLDDFLGNPIHNDFSRGNELSYLPQNTLRSMSFAETLSLDNYSHNMYIIDYYINLPYPFSGAAYGNRINDFFDTWEDYLWSSHIENAGYAPGPNNRMPYYEYSLSSSLDHFIMPFCKIIIPINKIYNLKTYYSNIIGAGTSPMPIEETYTVPIELSNFDDKDLYAYRNSNENIMPCDYFEEELEKLDNDHYEIASPITDSDITNLYRIHQAISTNNYNSYDDHQYSLYKYPLTTSFNIDEYPSLSILYYKEPTGSNEAMLAEGYIITKDILNPDLGYIPVAVQVCEDGFFGDGAPSRWISVRYCDRSSNPSNSYTNCDLYFGQHGSLSYNGVTRTPRKKVFKSGADESIASSPTNWYIPVDYAHPNDTNFIPSLINFSTGKWNKNQLYDTTDNISNYALLDIDGIGNTAKLVAATLQASNPNDPDASWKNGYYGKSGPGYSPQACAISEFAPLGTNPGDWYMPAAGELALFTYNAYRILNIFTNLRNAGYATYVLEWAISPGIGFFSSTECSETKVWFMHSATAYIRAISKTTNEHMIPFLDITKLNISARYDIKAEVGDILYSNSNGYKYIKKLSNSSSIAIGKYTDKNGIHTANIHGENITEIMSSNVEFVGNKINSAYDESVSNDIADIIHKKHDGDDIIINNNVMSIINIDDNNSSGNSEINDGITEIGNIANNNNTAVSKKFYPIGICVVPTDFYGPGEKARWVGLKFLSSKSGNEDTGSTTLNSNGETNGYYERIIWGGHRELSIVKPYYLPGFSSFVYLTNDINYYNTTNNKYSVSNYSSNNKYVADNKYYTLASSIASGNKDRISLYDDIFMYNERPICYRGGGDAGTVTYSNIDCSFECCAYGEIHGKTKTYEVLKYYTGEDWKTSISSSSFTNTTTTMFPLFGYVARYHTIGTNPGDWYIPALGELGMLITNLGQISYIQYKLHSMYLTYCMASLLNLSVSGNTCLWSSTEYGELGAYALNFKNGAPEGIDKIGHRFAIPFLEF